MPEGCSTWPAIWEADLDTWPEGGEIDILEGANDVGPNAVTLHTTSGCTMPVDRDQTGSTLETDCDTPDPDSVGCGVVDSNKNSYGPAFNKNGGGWYALERTESSIKVWFWPRNGKPPSEVKSGKGQINTDSWVSRLLEDLVQSYILTPSFFFLGRVPRWLSSPTRSATSRKSSGGTTLSST